MGLYILQGTENDGKFGTTKQDIVLMVKEKFPKAKSINVLLGINEVAYKEGNKKKKIAILQLKAIK